MWRQYTYIDGELKYGPNDRTDSKMMEMFAQLIFNRQVGENNELHIMDYDDMCIVTAYKAIRYLGTRVIEYRYYKIG